jgi:hypothetical protein
MSIRKNLPLLKSGGKYACRGRFPGGQKVAEDPGDGIGALRLQMYMTVTVIVFIPLAWLTSRLIHDINYFLAVMCLCIAPSWIVNKIQFYKILNGKATGIWKK